MQILILLENKKYMQTHKMDYMLFALLPLGGLHFRVSLTGAAPRGLPPRTNFRTWWALSNDTLRSKIGLGVEKLFKFNK